MADKKISDLDAIASVATGDLLVGVDISESPDKTVKFTLGNLTTSIEALFALQNVTAITSAQFRGICSDESGTGALLFAGGAIGAASATSLACGTFTTSSGAMGFTPVSGSGFNVTLAGAGDFAVNTNDIFVDTSAGRVGFGTVTPQVNGHFVTSEIRVDNTGSGGDGYIRWLNDSGSMSFGMSGASTNTALLFDRTNSQSAYAYTGGASGTHTFYQNNSAKMTIASSGVGVGTASFGTSASGVVAIANGTQGAALANAIQLVSEDLSAGNTILSMRTEGSGIVGSGTPTQDRTIAIKINGTVYYLLAATSAT